LVTNALSVCVPSSVGAGGASLPGRAQLDVLAIIAEALGSLRFGGAAAARRTVQMGDIQCNAKRFRSLGRKFGRGSKNETRAGWAATSSPALHLPGVEGSACHVQTAKKLPPAAKSLRGCAWLP